MAKSMVISSPNTVSKVTYVASVNKREQGTDSNETVVDMNIDSLLLVFGFRSP